MAEPIAPHRPGIGVTEDQLLPLQGQGIREACSPGVGLNGRPEVSATTSANGTVFLRVHEGCLVQVPQDANQLLFQSAAPVFMSPATVLPVPLAMIPREDGHSFPWKGGAPLFPVPMQNAAALSLRGNKAQEYAVLSYANSATVQGADPRVELQILPVLLPAHNNVLPGVGTVVGAEHLPEPQPAGRVSLYCDIPNGAHLAAAQKPDEAEGAGAQEGDVVSESCSSSSQREEKARISGAEATLSLMLTDGAVNGPAQADKDLHFPSLVELAKRTEVCKNTGRKSGSSNFLGVSKHRKSGRWESHVWMPEKSRQIYLGGFDCSMAAACAYDIVAIKVKGEKATTNFRKLLYSPYSQWIEETRVTEIIAHIRRQSRGFSRGHSRFRGVTQHPNGRWEARIGVGTKSHIYLGLYGCQEQAARHYDEALVRLKGMSATTNFPLMKYTRQIEEHRLMVQQQSSADKNQSLKTRKSMKVTVKWIKHGNGPLKSKSKKATA